MMMRAAILYAMGSALSLAIGWFVASPPNGDGVVAPSARVSVPSFEREGLQLALAVGDFTSLGLNVAPSPPGGEPEVAQEDIGDVFRRDLTAIVRNGSRTVVWVVDTESDLGRRALRRGSVFRDNWTIASIRDQEIVLAREGEERRVSIVSAPPPPAGAQQIEASRGREPAAAPGRQRQTRRQRQVESESQR